MSEVRRVCPWCLSKLGSEVTGLLPVSVLVFSSIPTSLIHFLNLFSSVSSCFSRLLFEHDAMFLFLCLCKNMFMSAFVFVRLCGLVG